MIWTLRFLLITSIFFSFTLQSQNLMDDWAEKWQHSSEYMIEIAELMPENQFTYKPTEVQMSFSDQLLHLSGNMVSLSRRFLNADSIDPPLPDSFTSKKEAIEELRRVFAHTAFQLRQIDASTLDDSTDFWAGPVPRSRIIWLITDHMAHHRGQLIVYLRLRGIEPPDYRGW